MHYGLIGFPLEHSFSKEIHEKLAMLDNNSSYKYDLYELNESNLNSFLEKKDFNAINVTIPYKKSVIPYLDYIDPLASKIGAINVIVNKDGVLAGYNSDYYGLKSLIIKNNIEIKNKHVLILGTGGASNTAYQVVFDLGAKEIKKASRNKNNGAMVYDEIYSSYNECEIIINTTPVGMFPNNYKSLIDLSMLNNIQAVIDIVYNPLNTKLLVDAKKNQIKCANGLYMLVSQAVYAYYLFLEKKLNEEEINKYTDIIYNDILKQKLNIVLIGMPSSGKSTIGAMLSKILNKDFIDIDLEIKKKINMEISDYINKYSESAFRDIEEEVIDEISKCQNKIIATGGGCILRSINIDKLKQNSIIYFLNRNLDKLMISDDRPLSNTFSALKKRYEERIAFYFNYADCVIDNNGTTEDTIKQIVEDYNG